MGEEIRTFTCIAEDGSEIKVVERRGNHGSAHGPDGVLTDPKHYTKYQTIDGRELSASEDGRLCDLANGFTYKIVRKEMD